MLGDLLLCFSLEPTTADFADDIRRRRRSSKPLQAVFT
jgi:hypothetical protein